MEQDQEDFVKVLHRHLARQDLSAQLVVWEAESGVRYCAQERIETGHVTSLMRAFPRE
jgi:hypothetical protein